MKQGFSYDKPIMTVNPKTAKTYISRELQDLFTDEITKLTFVNGNETMQLELQQWKINDNKINSVVITRKIVNFYNKGETFRLILSNGVFHLVQNNDE